MKPVKIIIPRKCSRYPLITFILVCFNNPVYLISRIRICQVRIAGRGAAKQAVRIIPGISSACCVRVSVNFRFMRQTLAGSKIIFGFFICHHIESIIIFHRDLIKCHIHIFYCDLPVPYSLGLPAVFSSHGCQNGIHIEHLPVQPEHTLRIFIAD